MLHAIVEGPGIVDITGPYSEKSRKGGKMITLHGSGSTLTCTSGLPEEPDVVDMTGQTSSDEEEEPARFADLNIRDTTSSDGDNLVNENAIKKGKKG